MFGTKKYSWLALLFLVLLAACSEPVYQPDVVNGPPTYGTFRCDAEVVEMQLQHDYFRSDSAYFLVSGEQSSEHAFEGQYSCKVFAEKEFGMALTLKDVRGDEYIRASVYRKSDRKNGALVIVGEDLQLIHQFSKSAVEVLPGGWEKLYVDLSVPANYTGEIRVYVHNPDTVPAWFDNLSVTWSPQQQFPPIQAGEGIALHLDTNDLSKMQRWRDSSFAAGLILDKLKKYRSGTMVWQGQEMAAEMRVKGDWLDHLQGDKWSFRVKIEDEAALDGMRTFSVQGPGTRAHLYEWVMHKLCEHVDVLTTRYRFEPVSLNGKSLGIYAVEEHFEKQLVESRERREGPILKFNEAPFWATMEISGVHGPQPKLPHSDIFAIDPFKKGKTTKSPTLSANFSIAARLLEQYRQGAIPVSELFHVDRLARYYALMDLGQVEHGLSTHNQRWYYNPVLSVLEPIAYDLYGGTYEQHESALPMFDRYGSQPGAAVNANKFFQISPFNDSTFVKLYLNYLNQYSEPAFIDSFMTSISEEMQLYQQRLRTESPFPFDENFLSLNAASLRVNLDKILPRFQEPSFGFRRADDPEYDCPPGFLTNPPKDFVQAHSASGENWSSTTVVRNFLCAPIAVVGYGVDKKVLYDLPEIATVGAGSGSKPGISASISLPGHPKYLYYTVGTDTMQHRIRCRAWAFPEGPVPRQQIGFQLQLPASAMVNGQEIFFAGKQHRISKDVIIPAGYTVRFEAGATLQFSDAAQIITESPLYAEGVDSIPVQFVAEQPGSGVVVLQAAGVSRIKHATFVGMSPLSRDGWQLTGGITFYESDVEMSHVNILQARGEDALNVVRSHFDLAHCLIDSTESDAFDADFCSGTIRECTVRKSGNDALDFSGAKSILVTGCTIESPGDKGISCGEASSTIVKNSRVSNALIGLACKDQSELVAENVELVDCGIGTTTFRKKPEYGPAKLTANGMKLINATTAHITEVGSLLILDGKEVKGDEADIDRFGWY